MLRLGRLVGLTLFVGAAGVCVGCASPPEEDEGEASTQAITEEVKRPPRKPTSDVAELPEAEREALVAWVAADMARAKESSVGAGSSLFPTLFYSRFLGARIEHAYTLLYQNVEEEMATHWAERYASVTGARDLVELTNSTEDACFDACNTIAHELGMKHFFKDVWFESRRVGKCVETANECKTNCFASRRSFQEALTRDGIVIDW